MQEYELSELRQANTLLFLVHDVRLQADLKREKDKKEGGRKTRCLGELAAYLKSKDVPGGTRLKDASDLEVNKGVLRFKSPHQDAKAGVPWAWELVLTSTCCRSIQEAVSDMDQDGGCAGVTVKRPSQRLGPMAIELESLLYPQRAADRVEWKGKKGKGKGKGKDKGKGKNKDKGQDVDMGGVVNQAPPVMAPPGGEPPVVTAAAGPAAAAPTAAPAAAAGSAGAASGSAVAPAAAATAAASTPTGSRLERSRSPSGPRLGAEVQVDAEH